MIKLIDYLKARRIAEENERRFEKEVLLMVEKIKVRNFPTAGLMWDELIKMAEEPQQELFKIL